MQAIESPRWDREERRMSMTPERARELLALAPKDELRVVTHRKMLGDVTMIECGVFDYAAPPRCAELFAASADALRAYLAAVERAEAAERELAALRAKVAQIAPSPRRRAPRTRRTSRTTSSGSLSVTRSTTPWETRSQNCARRDDGGDDDLPQET